ncbi:catalase [Bacillus sp. AGMB 02131]|uniref:catalase n=1 Tax=Peribacillus faecalis TaxID=2772559 RepID=A0A927HB02_9BACI|nr:catalase [Peribacillus faecalis]MBD3106898.1 catalase [Peribacillus faecalis]
MDMNLIEQELAKNACRRGPFVLEEPHIAEALAYYGKEILPESTYGACGFSAFGTFKLTNSMKAYTDLAFFQDAGEETAISAHFATNAHGVNTTETVREPHEFTVKFLADKGNYEFVGSNLPVSFVRDPIVSLKMKGELNNLDPVHYWSFMAQNSETTNMLLHLYTDEGIPASYRTMRGTTVHAYRMTNAEGKEYYVKLRYIPKQGIVSLKPNEAERVKVLDRHYATHDMYIAIERGDYPEWDLFMQVLDPEKNAHYSYDPLDPTNDWLECDFPYHKVGIMTLNEVAVLDREERLSEKDYTTQWLEGSLSKQNQDAYKQAGEIYRSYREDIQKTVIANLVHELSQLKDCNVDIVREVIMHFYQADKQLGESLADGCGIHLRDLIH